MIVKVWGHHVLPHPWPQRSKHCSKHVQGLCAYTFALIYVLTSRGLRDVSQVESAINGISKEVGLARSICPFITQSSKQITAFPTHSGFLILYYFLLVLRYISYATHLINSTNIQYEGLLSSYSHLCFYCLCRRSRPGWQQRTRSE